MDDKDLVDGAKKIFILFISFSWRTLVKLVASQVDKVYHKKIIEFFWKLEL